VPLPAAGEPAGVVTGSAESRPSSSTGAFQAPVAATAPTVAREVVSAASAHRGESTALDLDTIRKLWPDLIKKVDKRMGLTLTQVEPINFEQPDVLAISVKPGYNSTFDAVDTPEAQTKIAQALHRLVHRPVKIKYVPRAADDHARVGAQQNEAKRADSLSKDPMVQRVLELFEARPVQMDYDEDDTSPEN
jgi:DNA polymerase III subunit gamma/tau